MKVDHFSLVTNEPQVATGSNQERLRQIQERISEIRAALASGNETLATSRKVLHQLEELELKCAEVFASAKQLLRDGDKVKGTSITKPQDFQR